MGITPSSCTGSGDAGTIEDIEGLQAALDSKASTAHVHAASAVTVTPAGGIAADDVQEALEELDSEKAAVGHDHDSDYAALSHAHAISDTTGLQTALDGKASTSHNHDGTYATAGHNHDGTYATAGHVHAASAVTVTPAGGIAADDVQEALEELDSEKAAVGHDHDADYAALSHTHAISDTTGLQTALDGKVDEAHTGEVGITPAADDEAALRLNAFAPRELALDSNAGHLQSDADALAGIDYPLTVFAIARSDSDAETIQGFFGYTLTTSATLQATLRFYRWSDGKMYWHVRHAPGTNVFASIDFTLGDAAWHSWFGEILTDGTTNIELDRVAGTSGAIPGAAALDVSADNVVTIGTSFVSSLWKDWLGAVAKVGIWYRELTTGEKDWLHNSGRGRHQSEVDAHGTLSDYVEFWDLTGPDGGGEWPSGGTANLSEIESPATTQGIIGGATTQTADILPIRDADGNVVAGFDSGGHPYATESATNNNHLVRKEDADADYATAGHNHDADYAAAAHVHAASAVTVTPAGGIAADDVQEALEELDSEKAAVGHDHDSDYAALSHAHAISDTTGLQTALDGKASTSHNHDGTYATAGHNHDGTYATAGHNHDGTYATAGHVHAASAVTVTPAGGIAADDVQEALEELDSEKAAVGHDHDGDYLGKLTAVTVDHTDFSGVPATLSMAAGNEYRSNTNGGGGDDYTYELPATPSDGDVVAILFKAIHATDAINIDGNGSDIQGPGGVLAASDQTGLQGKYVVFTYTDASFGWRVSIHNSTWPAA